MVPVTEHMIVPSFLLVSTSGSCHLSFIVLTRSVTEMYVATIFLLLDTDPVAELKVARSKIEELEKSVESYKKEVSVRSGMFVVV